MDINIKKKTINGLFWSINSKSLTHLFNLIITAILARLLLPEDFGIVGMSLIIIGLVSIINESGLTTALIQKKDLDDSHLHTAFWTSISTGIVLYAGTFLLSPYVADFFKTDLVELIIKVASLSFLISSVTIVHRSLLAKNLNFRLVSITEISGSLISGTFAVYLAISGFGLWSLVAKNLLNDLIVVLLTLLMYPWKPAFKFNKTKFNELFGFSIYVTGGNILKYFRENIDYIIIGRVLGAELLGYYTLAYTLAVFPATKIVPVITRVVFPAFSLLQDDIVRFRKGYRKLVYSLSLITIPSLMGLAVVAPELIIQVYGNKWTPAIVPLQILCIHGLLESISRTSRSVFYAQGSPETELKLNLLKVVISFPIIYIGSFYGILGVATTVASLSLFYLLITQSTVNLILQLKWIEYFTDVKTSLFASLLMCISIILYKHWIYPKFFESNINMLISSIIIGIILYIIIIYAFNQDFNKTINTNLKNRISKYKNYIYEKNRS
ncbi:MOP flippase family protein [Methanolobus halotolerans]|uniref:Colanic acid exporter n=1 Tax=Methanolobus halotolerans TaxID=2052935 RepID=A0A4E0PZ27_9EURY|nr:MOP flippase family protein [Methanolobus halotolerans]TGC11568.1 colanic acid exporter [Methanolobus halotolerans]